MTQEARVVAFPPQPSGDPFLETDHARVHLLAPSSALPADADAVLDLADGSRLAYVPRAPGGPAKTLAFDPFLRGNAFQPVFESARSLGALLSLAASRRLDTGPESERVFVFLRGTGLLSLENGDALRFSPHTVGVVPAGEPARVWAQGPEDALALVLQPRGQQEPRRTLAGEVAKRRGP